MEGRVDTATRVDAIASRWEAIATRLEAIATGRLAGRPSLYTRWEAIALRPSLLG